MATRTGKRKEEVGDVLVIFTRKMWGIVFLIFGVFFSIDVYSWNDLCTQRENEWVKVGLNESNSSCAKRAYTLGLMPSKVVDKVYCLGVFEGVPLIKANKVGIIYYATEVNGKMFMNINWNLNCPNYS